MTKDMEALQLLLTHITRAEKAQVLQWVARDLGGAFPGVDAASDVCGGAATVVRTRIPIWLLEHTRRTGATEADILRAYPVLRAEDLANAWGYVRTHAEEIEREIAANDAA